MEKAINNKRNNNINQLSEKVLNEFSSLDSLSVLSELKSSENGLTHAEAQYRLEKYGHNILSEKKEKHIIVRFLSQFVNPLIIILLVAAVVSFFTGSHVDATIIVSIILISVILGFVQLYSTEKALEKLKDVVKTTSTVLRDGKEIEIHASQICVGDILVLSSGDVVSADARIIESKDFFVNQSSITGESYPSQKISIKTSSKVSSLAELSNMIFLGSNVVSGTAKAIVVKTGKNTEYGTIASKLAEAPQKSEFERGVNNFGFFITKIIIVLVLFIFLFNSVMKNNVLESFMFAIAIAVGVTPELLPMIMSITMAKGAKNMSTHGVLVKKLSTIPNFGSMDVLCTDKTGTLTENNIQLVTYTDIQGKHSPDVLLYTYLNSFHQTGIKNPLDDAVLKYKTLPIHEYKKVDEVPFDFVRKRVSVVVKIKGKE
ncbi:MAG: HAD-IC family P-type ATPase, partial [Candidatus Woesearchaeota archaeon]